jgi:hypothetical protein
MAGLPLRAYTAAPRHPIFGTRRKDAEMMNLFKVLVSDMALPSVSERERAYLNASVSRFDLERREREIEAGLFRLPHPYF